VPKDETGAPLHVTPLPAPALRSAEVLNDAQTTRLSKEEIERVNQAMLAATRGHGPLSAGELDAVIAEAIAAPEIAPPVPSGPRTGLIRRPMAVDPRAADTRAADTRAARLQLRDRRLKLALGSVVALIILTGAAIIWLLAHPVVSSNHTRAHPTQSQVRPNPRPAAVAKRAVRPPPRRADNRVPAAHPAATLTQVFVAAPTPDQRFRLYVDGELHPLKGHALHLARGRHTVRAPLLPQGTLTDEKILVVRGSPLNIQL